MKREKKSDAVSLTRILRMLDSNPIKVPLPEGIWSPFKYGFIIDREDLNVIEKFAYIEHIETFLFGNGKQIRTTGHAIDYSTQTLSGGTTETIYIHFPLLNETKATIENLILWIEDGWLD